MNGKGYTTKLSNIANVVQGQSPESKYYSNTEGVPFLQGNRTFGKLYPTFDTYTSKVTKLAKCGEVLMSVRAPVGDLNFAPSDLCIGRGLASISSKTGNNKFLYYALKYNVGNLLKQGAATTFDAVNKDIINDFELIIPEDPSDRDKVESALTVIDSKIELNNKINSELESMAKMIYDYWFVQFDFPDKNSKPYKTSGGEMVWVESLKRHIPQNWEAKVLLDIVQIGTEQANPLAYPEKKFKHISIPVLDATNSYGIEIGSTIGSNKFIVGENAVLVSKLNPWFNRVYYPRDTKDMICTTEMVVWKCKNRNLKNYLYQLAQTPHFISYCTKSSTGTSNSHKRISPSVMMQYKLPSSLEVFEKYGETVDPYIQQIMVNKDENKYLAELRDWLLPMLMNGQVTIKG